MEPLEPRLLLSASSPFELADLLPAGGGNGTSGFVIQGTNTNDGTGYTVRSAGDLNGDGLDDLILGTYLAGVSYVVFGNAGGYDAELDLSSLDGSNGFMIEGPAANTTLGRSASGAGDVNGDGFDDLVIGDQFADANGNSNAGKSYVVFGKAGDFAARLDLSSLDGTNGFVINGKSRFDGSGSSVGGAGDINGDGFDDIVIGAVWANYRMFNYSYGGRAGESYVIFGKAGSFDAELDLTDLDGTNGFTIPGFEIESRFGGEVSGTGDINGDGFDDLIFGAWGANDRFHYYSGPYGVGAGAAYIVFGKADGFSRSQKLRNPDGSGGVTINGLEFGDHLGRSVSGAGDINGDGLDDLIIGAYRAEANGKSRAGISYVIFGRADGFADGIDLTKLNGQNGFIVEGKNEGDFLGRSVSGVGDINGDGYDDLIIGANGADPDGKYSAGSSYVIYGRAKGFDAKVNISSLKGAKGFVINGAISSERSGNSVSGAGDINGDGIDDLIIGAPGYHLFAEKRAGAGYVIFGKASPTPTPAVDGDFTGDGKADILWRDTRDGRNAVWQFDGTTFELETLLKSLPNTDWKLVGTGDFTGDGKNDILWRNTRDGRNRVWEMDGTEFVQRIDIKTMYSMNWQVAGVGDFNDDGWDDILWRNTRNGRNIAWSMFGAEFLESVSLKRLANQDWQAAAVGDLTGDGKDDILWRNRSTGQNSVWQMNGALLQSTHKIKRIKNPAWQIAGIADYTGDGVSDILWRHTARGLNSVWQMNNTTFRVGIPLPSLTDLQQQPASPLLGLWEA